MKRIHLLLAITYVFLCAVAFYLGYRLPPSGPCTPESYQPALFTDMPPIIIDKDD
jgi:hypothetical protein